MRPDIDRDLLAMDTRSWLETNGLSTRNASARFPGLNPAMISRACRCQPLSAASLLTLAKVMQRDPMRYLTFATTTQRNHTVTAIGKRETREDRL